jgi:exodeoxyribonuclease VII large subunit
VRAATPSHASQLAAPRLNDVLDRLEALRQALPAALVQRVKVARGQLEALAQSYALRHPEQRVAMSRQRLDDLAARLLPAGAHRFALARERLAAFAGRLESLSPLKVLERGYSVTLRERDGKVLKKAEDAEPGENIQTKLAQGTIVSKVIPR